MPKRQYKRVDCKSVQGEGAFMLIKPLSFKERMEGDLQTKDLLARVLEWNWVDWEGEPLPLPSDAEIGNLLNDEEIQLILNSLGMVFTGATDDDSKN